MSNGGRINGGEIKRAWNRIQFLSNSYQRVKLLDALTDAPADLRTLKDELDTPRTTLQRNLSMLERRGWIEKTSSGYSTTTTGCVLVTEVLRLIETIERIDTLSPFLEVVDVPQYLDVARLEEPSVTIPEPDRPYGPKDRLLETLDTAAFLRGFLPVVSPSLASFYRQRNGIGSEGSELVLTSETIESLCNRYPREGWGPTGERRIELFLYDGELPFGLIIFGDRIALAAYDDVGRIQALVESTGHGAIEWGEVVYEKFRQQSSRLCDAQ